MFDLASIRNASFTLTPTGYNPEEVDQFLADLADQLAEEVHAAQAAPAVARPDHAELNHAEPEYVESTEPAADVWSPSEPESSLPTIADLSEPVGRPEADLDGLSACIERTISSLDSFVSNELAAVRAASDLEVDEIHRERERLLEEAAAAARAHLDDARVRAERIVVEARGNGDELRRRFEQELAVERDRFEQSLAEREAEGRAAVSRALEEAEDRRREADDVVARANRVQLQVLESLEQARASLGASIAVPERVDASPADDEPSGDLVGAGEPEAAAEPASEPDERPEAWPRQVHWPQDAWDGDGSDQESALGDGGGRYPEGSADATDAAA